MKDYTNKKAYIVIGLGYGDEGKGLVTDYLCSKHANSIVIRFNGGQQAGHTVVTKHLGKHMFSNFGSGTLRKVPTYWSKYCTFSPAYFLLEYNVVPVKPRIFLDSSCAVTTHYDVLFNRAIEFTRGELKHGSCGLGFGATINRHKTIDFTIQDLYSKFSYKEKLKRIKLFYTNKFDLETNFNFNDFNHDLEDQKFEQYVDELQSLIEEQVINVVSEDALFADFHSYDTLIFEGSQGILLDINFGKHPHVTKSNTTSRNALEILRRNCFNIDTEIVYVTRAYQTRHGAGPFNQIGYNIDVKNQDFETNKFNEYQGNFRIGCLNIEDLNFAIACDETFSWDLKKNLFVTCIDQVSKDCIPVIDKGSIENIPYTDIPNYLNCQFESCKYSFSNCTEDLA